MTKHPIPTTVLTSDGYVLHWSAEGYTDGDLTWTHKQIAAALLTGEVVPA